MKIPEDIITKMKNCGAYVEVLNEGQFYKISGIDYDDKSWNIYKDWVVTNKSENIKVNCNFGCIKKDYNTKKICDIMKEARSIIRNFSDDIHYSIIGESFPDKVRYQNFICNKLVMSDIIKNIIYPPENYTHLNLLKKGSFITNITYVWSNAVIKLELYKETVAKLEKTVAKLEETVEETVEETDKHKCQLN